MAGNPFRGYYWRLRKQGLSKKDALAQTKKHFSVGRSYLKSMPRRTAKSGKSKLSFR